LVREDERYAIMANCFAVVCDDLGLRRRRGYEPPAAKDSNTGYGIEWYRCFENPRWQAASEIALKDGSSARYRASFSLLYRARANWRSLSLRLDYSCSVPRKGVQSKPDCDAIRRHLADILWRRKSELKGWRLRNDWYFQAFVQYDPETSKLTLQEWQQEITERLLQATCVLNDIFKDQ